MTTNKRRINEGGHSQNFKRRKLSDESLLEIERISSSTALAGQSLRAVSLRADGTFMEVLLPLTKKLSKRATILGNWDFIEVILVLLDDQEDEDISFNTHILLPPFQNTKFRGDILLIKRDVEGSPVDYSITSYKDFLQLESAEFSCEFHDAKCSGETSHRIYFWVKLNCHCIFASLLPLMNFVTEFIGDDDRHDGDNKEDLDIVNHYSTVSAEQEF